MQNSQTRSAAENATPPQDWTNSPQYTSSGDLHGTTTSATDARPLRWHTALVQVPDTSRGAHRTLADRGQRDVNSLYGMCTNCREADTMVVEGYVTVVGAGAEWRYIIYKDPPLRTRGAGRDGDSGHGKKRVSMMINYCDDWSALCKGRTNMSRA